MFWQYKFTILLYDGEIIENLLCIIKSRQNNYVKSCIRHWACFSEGGDVAYFGMPISG